VFIKHFFRYIQPTQFAHYHNNGVFILKLPELSNKP